MGLEIPPIHYMIACVGGDNIRCAPYATFGSQELSDHAVKALQDRMACLLAHHGMIAGVGKPAHRAMPTRVLHVRVTLEHGFLIHNTKSANWRFRYRGSHFSGS